MSCLSFTSFIRGDTIDYTCKSVDICFKLNLRVLILIKDEAVINDATEEIIRKTTKASSKLTEINTECHKNVFFESLT